jgi:hypothetical protein
MHGYIPRNLSLIVCAAAAAVAALAAGCATARVASNWAPSPVAANGIIDDWTDKQACSMMKNGLQLSVANDAERLYVIARFRANDPQWSGAVSHGGMTLRVAGPGKRVMSFRLPKGPKHASGPGWQAGPGYARETIRNPQADFGPVPAAMWAELKDRLVVTDVDRNVIRVEPDGSAGPAAGFSDDNGMCVYEFSVPLRDTAFGHYSLGAGAGTGLNLTVTAGPSAEMRRVMPERRQPQGMTEGDRGFGGGEGGPGGRSGFAGGRGGHQGGHPDGPATANPSLSVAVKLAAKP